MRAIVSLMHVSLDGFVADLKAPPPGLDWMAYTPELEAEFISPKAGYLE